MTRFHVKWVVLRHHMSSHNHYRVQTGIYHLPGCTHAKTICCFSKTTSTFSWLEFWMELWFHSWRISQPLRHTSSLFTTMLLMFHCVITLCFSVFFQLMISNRPGFHPIFKPTPTFKQRMAYSSSEVLIHTINPQMWLQPPDLTALCIHNRMCNFSLKCFIRCQLQLRNTSRPIYTSI